MLRESVFSARADSDSSSPVSLSRHRRPCFTPECYGTEEKRFILRCWYRHYMYDTLRAIFYGSATPTLDSNSGVTNQSWTAKSANASAKRLFRLRQFQSVFPCLPSTTTDVVALLNATEENFSFCAVGTDTTCTARFVRACIAPRASTATAEKQTSRDDEIGECFGKASFPFPPIPICLPLSPSPTTADVASLPSAKE